MFAAALECLAASLYEGNFWRARASSLIAVPFLVSPSLRVREEKREEGEGQNQPEEPRGGQTLPAATL